MTVSPESVPALRRGIRRRFDATRDAHVLLGPERVIVLDEIALAIAELLDGARDVAEISRLLASRFQADQEMVRADVMAFIEELVAKGLVRV